MKLLIITPTLGSSPFLAETVASIRTLGFPVQHILSCPRNRLAELKMRFPGSQVVTDHGREAGLYGAINAGLSAADASWDFFTYLNDDDLLGRDFEAMFRRHAAPSRRDTVGFGRVTNIDESGRKLMGITVGPIVSHYPALLRMGISPTGQQGMAFGRRVVETIGLYTTRYKICGDLDYWCRAMAAGFRFRYYPLEAGRFRIQQGQISGDTATLQRELAEIARIHFPRESSILLRLAAKFIYRVYNAPRYADRIFKWGFKGSYELLESKPQSAA